MSASAFSTASIEERALKLAEGELALKAAVDELSRLPKGLDVYAQVKAEVSRLRGHVSLERCILFGLRINSAVNRPRN